jgi:hypothetical protein
MADDLKQTGKADEKLRSAVRKAGSLVKDVRRHLSR